MKQGEGPDAGVLPDHRHHLHAEVHASHLDGLGGQGLAALEALDEGDVRENLFTPLPLDQGGADPGHVLGVAAAGEDLPLFVDADLQTLHQNVELALQADGPGEHPVEAVVAGGDLLGVPLKGRFLQHGFQTQAEGDLDHHAGGADPLAQVDDGNFLFCRHGQPPFGWVLTSFFDHLTISARVLQGFRGKSGRKRWHGSCFNKPYTEFEQRGASP